MPFHPILLLIPIPLANVVYALYRGKELLAAAQLAIVISSVIYWSNTKCSTSRMLDMFIVKVGILIHFIYNLYYAVWAPIILFGLLAYVYMLGVHFNSDLIHSFIWIIGAACNFMTVYFT
jgi:hypothetical protein